MTPLRLSAVRLVGFHNYGDVLLQVRGDLFVCGQNESGKTTILDAIQMVLSGEHHFDWNAAANLAGPRQTGRTLQGIVLRADLAGNPTRDGGSIAYAVVELEPVSGKQAPTTLVFGASARSMNAMADRWTAIVEQRAADLPLTELSADGGSRIRDRDELEALIGCRLHRGSRGLGDYRRRVGDLLFPSSDGFERVTSLWRRAKSYRELARSARSMTEIIRQVLPPPDPEPFQKIIKCFQDIAEIEENLAALQRDVNALHALRDLLEEARESRESLRRYEYIRAIEHERGLTAQVTELTTRQATLQQELEQLERDVASLEQCLAATTERLERMYERNEHQLLVRKQLWETDLRQSQSRLAEITADRGRKEQELERALAQLTEQQRVSQTELDAARELLQSIAEQFEPAATSVAAAARQVAEGLPSDFSMGFHDQAFRTVLQELLGILTRERLRGRDELDSIEAERARLRAEQELAEQSLSQLERHEDLVPQITGLDAALNALHDSRIAFALLYQLVEWAGGEPLEVRSAVEAALGIERLSTIIVSSEDTAEARRLVFSVATNVRVLDAETVDALSDTDDESHPSIYDRLICPEDRANSYLKAIAGRMVLEPCPPAEGTPGIWFVIEGQIGEDGSRRRLQLDEPMWIGSADRGRVRQARLAEARCNAERLTAEMQAAFDRYAGLAADVSALHAALDQLETASLAQRVRLAHDDLVRKSRIVVDMQTDWESRAGELEREQTRYHELQQRLTDLNQQLELDDIRTFGEALEALKSEKARHEQTLAKARADLSVRRQQADECKARLLQASAALQTARVASTDARESLRAVIPRSLHADLDQYVFETKRGAQIKPENLEQNILLAVRRDSALAERLRGHDGVLSNNLSSSYGFRVVDGESLPRICDRRDEDLQDILAKRQEQQQELSESLDSRLRHLFETILTRDLIDRLRAEMVQLERTIHDINRKLKPLSFGGTRFQLQQRTVTEHQRFVDLIQRQAVTDEAGREELRHYFTDRRGELVAEEEIPPFLDYRQWYEFHFRLLRDAQPDGPSLGSEDMFRGSVGAQTTHNYLLLLAMSALLFDSCQARLRLLLLDDAFFGLDGARREMLLQCGKQMGLDFVIATPDLDGTILEKSSESTTVLVEKTESGEVLVYPFRWEQVPEQPELFAEPRPPAVIGDVDDA